MLQRHNLVINSTKKVHKNNQIYDLIDSMKLLIVCKNILTMFA